MLNLFQKNQLICGDNLQTLALLPAESVDLIYIDPPFFSNRHYEIIWGDEAEVRSFDDRWEGGINVYIEWMKDRVFELHRVLKPTGSFYLHCDWHASHYLKCMCDDIFGMRNFRNEIVWCYSRPSAPNQKQLSRVHDIILWYSKSKTWTFNPEGIRQPYAQSSLDREGYGGGASKMTAGLPVELKEGGKFPEDWIYLPMLKGNSKERLGYPTQKPEALLERIIKASSNPNDIVLDCFCGCGTSIAVAQKLGRKWIGIDISPTAIAMIKNRLSKDNVPENNYDVIGMPQKVDDLKDYKPYEFQYWIINEMHGSPSPRKSGDMGIDGFSYLNHYPIQVKQSESIGRNVVDNFETALKRYYTKHKGDMFGYIVAFSFGKGAYEEVARAKKDGFNIELITVQDILDKRFVVTQTSRQSMF